MRHLKKWLEKCFNAFFQPLLSQSDKSYGFAGKNPMIMAPGPECVPMVLPIWE
jgi:hypothetical protein